MPDKSKTAGQVDRFIHMVARKQGWSVCPDSDFLDHLRNGLTTTHNRTGYFLCPCRDGSGDKHDDADIICPCDYNVDDQKQYGHCFCGLFYRPGFLEEGGEFAQIPDRRPEELYD